ncbi:uncharacterized protein LOC116805016 [Drosophila grimshawi]|uniref:uncharacterized protein LOC116805016 n=1 Tax=Drosophila grimshawi TaxID=7222 RepID=UPI0013EEF8D7|nr:uncharacterized protein LOC116805016 [Drosophila grimshawi]
MGDDAAAEPAPAPAPAPAGTTTAGAFMVGSNVWLTAGAVIAFSTYALWVELRKMATKSKLLKDTAEPEEGGTKTDKNISITHCEEYQLDESGSLQKQITGIHSL